MESLWKKRKTHVDPPGHDEGIVLSSICSDSQTLETSFK